MSQRLISGFLLRAPLLPVAALRRPAAALRSAPLGPEALALASPDLAAGLARGGRRVEASVGRYGRRAAFRPTPHGLLAGVMMGRLGARTAIATGAPDAHRTVPWARLASVGRALLEDPETRARVRLRVAPSLLAQGGEVAWLALPGGDAPLELRQGELDEGLAAALEAAADWSPWEVVRAACPGDEENADPETLDEYLLMLIDQGLLHHDLSPPLVGPPPLAWMEARLAALDTAAATEAVRRLAAEARSLATLRHAGRAVLSRAAVARAAALAPLLFRLQEALSPPASERALSPGLRARLDGLAELFGAGRFDLPGLATGSYGEPLAALDEEPPQAQSPAPALLGWLAGALTETARAGAGELVLDAQVLDGLLPPAASPASFELILGPCRASSGGAPGTDWLLGTHAPAGASWGRFAHALGAPMTAALDELVAAERGERAFDVACDVAYAASASLADLGTHPPVRSSALALAGWPAAREVAPCELGLVLGGEEPSLVAGGRPLRPSPLHRVRSTTAPAGLHRLLAGWSFVRQHAPWAFVWGALGNLPRLPRVRLEGFVVAPASWAIPPAEALAGRGLARWRAAYAVPRRVQVGEGDELLLVDLESEGARADLARHGGARAHEIWPPLDRLIDEGGRRVEAVVAVVQEVDVDDEIDVERSLPVGEVAAVPDHAWRTFQLFGPEDRQDDVLLTLTPLIAEAQAEALIDRWHFLRYLEQHRAHLRLRVRVPTTRAGELFVRRLRAQLEPLREASAVVALETAEYFPERARYGGPDTFAVVEQLFELDSELVLRLLAVDVESPEPLVSDRIEWLVRAFDALARGLGLDAAGRQALAARQRAAHTAAGHLPPAGTPEARAIDEDFRGRQRRLAGLLAGTAADGCSAPLDGHAIRVQAVVAELDPAARAALLAVLGPVLHLNAVRLVGAHPGDEAAAHLFWERTLEGLAARRRRGV